MKEIYLVTQGQYSDYSVRGVFVDKELAAEFAAQISAEYDTAKVDTRPIMTELTMPINYRGYTFIMDVDGNTDGVRQRGVDEYNDENDGSYPEDEYVRHVPSGIVTTGRGSFISTGRYKFFIKTDKGAVGAIKIANEKRIQMIANGTWPKKGEQKQ